MVHNTKFNKSRHLEWSLLSTCDGDIRSHTDAINQMTNPAVIGLQITSGIFKVKEYITAIHTAETAEPAGRGPVDNNSFYLWQHPKPIFDKQWSWLQETRKGVTVYVTLPSHEELYTLRSCIKCLNEWGRWRAGKDRACIWSDDKTLTFSRGPQK